MREREPARAHTDTCSLHGGETLTVHEAVSFHTAAGIPHQNLKIKNIRTENPQKLNLKNPRNQFES